MAIMEEIWGGMAPKHATRSLGNGYNRRDLVWNGRRLLQFGERVTRVRGESGERGGTWGTWGHVGNVGHVFTC